MWNFGSSAVKHIIFSFKPKGGANCWITALQGSSHSLARGAPVAFPHQIHWIRATWQDFFSRNTFFSAKGEDFIKLKVEGHSGAAAAVTLGRLARAGAVAASQLLFPRKEKPRGSGLLPMQVLAGAKRAATERELGHVDSCQGILFQPPRASTPTADSPSGSPYGLRVFSAGPGGGTGRGSTVLALHPGGTVETFGREGICAKGGCVWPGEMELGKGEKPGSLFQVRKMLVM